MDFNTLLYKLVLISSITYILVIYSDIIKSTYNNLLEYLKIKTESIKSKTDIQKLIVLKSIYDEFLKDITEEFIIYKVEPMLKIPDNTIMTNSGELKLLREEYVKFVLDKINTNKIIREYINTVYKSMEDFIVCLMIYFDTNIYMKIILPFIEDKTTIIKR